MTIRQTIIQEVQTINHRYVALMGTHKQEELLLAIRGICQIIDNAKTPVALRSEMVMYVEKNKRWSISSLFGLNLANKYYRDIYHLFQDVYSHNVIREAFDQELLQKMTILNTLEETVLELQTSTKIQKEELQNLNFYKDKFFFLEKEFNQLREEKMALEEKLVVAEKSVHPDNQALYEKYINIEEKLNQLKQANAALAKQILQLQKENNALVTENQKLLSENHKLEAALKAMQSELLMYRSQSVPNFTQRSRSQFWNEGDNTHPIPPRLNTSLNTTLEDYHFEV